MRQAGFERAIPTSERPQTQAVDRADKDIYTKFNMKRKFSVIAQLRFCNFPSSGAVWTPLQTGSLCVLVDLTP
jgi:hypothetical protein